MPKKKPTSPRPNITPSGTTPIEEAIGDRAKTKEDLKEIAKTKQAESTPRPLSEIPDEPSPQEMLNLEELNRQTEERLQNYEPSQEVKTAIAETQIPYVPPKMMTPVSKPDPQPVTETFSPESPPQKNENAIGKLEALLKEEIPKLREEGLYPVEDIELTALRKYILEDGFVVATVAFHIVSLCAQPMTTPSTTMWDFRDRAMIPEMVLALLNQPGYLEGIWPSLRIVMGSNKGNAAWTAGIATTIAFFDVIRTLPALEELKNETV